MVDDEAHVRNVVTRMIGNAGYAVLEARDGEEALAQLEKEAACVDLVLLDLTMPRRDGLSTLDEMRRRGVDVPVVVASGYSRDSLPEHVAVAGFVHKPFRKQLLLHTIAGVLASEGGD